MKYFTLREANGMLPALREKMLELQQLKREFEEKYCSLRQLKMEVLIDEQDKGIQEDPFFRLEAELEFLALQAKMIIDSIHECGVQVKGIEEGLLDFPAVIHGEEVLLCWKLGEPEITHYHGLQEGYAGRKRLPQDLE